MFNAYIPLRRTEKKLSLYAVGNISRKGVHISLSEAEIYKISILWLCCMRLFKIRMRQC